MGQSDDILEIQMLGQRYADAVVRHDPDDWSRCWSKDGVWDLGSGSPIEGRDSIVGAWKMAMEGFPFAVFFVFPAIVRVEGDRATARCYVEENLEDREGNGVRVYGAYDDELVREDGAWSYARRRYNVIFRGPASFDGERNEYRGRPPALGLPGS